VKVSAATLDRTLAARTIVRLMSFLPLVIEQSAPAGREQGAGIDFTRRGG
jgi:hypothetical protein